MQIFINISTCIVTEVCFALANFLHYHSAFLTRVGNNLAQRLFDGTLDDVDTGSFIGIVALQTFQSIQCTNVSHTTTGNNAFFDSGTSSAESIIYAVFLLFHFHFGSSAYVQNSYTT